LRQVSGSYSQGATGRLREINLGTVSLFPLVIGLRFHLWRVSARPLILSWAGQDCGRPPGVHFPAGRGRSSGLRRFAKWSMLSDYDHSLV